MKLMQVRPGKFVAVSAQLADKAARAFSSVAFSRDQIQKIAAAESRAKVATGAMLGGNEGWPRFRKISPKNELRNCQKITFTS